MRPRLPGSRKWSGRNAAKPADRDNRRGVFHRLLRCEPLEDRSLLSVAPPTILPLNVVLISDAVAQAQQIRAAAAMDTIPIVYHSRHDDHDRARRHSCLGVGIAQRRSNRRRGDRGSRQFRRNRPWQVRRSQFGHAAEPGGCLGTVALSAHEQRSCGRIRLRRGCWCGRRGIC